MNVTAFIYQLKVMSYQFQIESIERRERSRRAEREAEQTFCAKCSSIVICGIFVLPIPLGSVLLIAGIYLIEWPTSDNISNIDNTEKDVLRYLL